MKVNILLFLAIAAIILSGCARFDKTHFYSSSFGIDLTEAVQSYESHYTDGVLEIYNVSPDDELYKEVFEGKNIERYPYAVFTYRSTEYRANAQSPIEYIDLGGVSDSNFDEIMGKYILYLPVKKMMVFMYADGMGR